MRRIRIGEAEAWRHLVDLYSPLILSWCRRCGLGREDSADLLQDVFATVAKNIASFRRDQPGGTFRGWLRIIARNRIRLFYRRRKSEPCLAPDTPIDSCVDRYGESVGDEVDLPPEDGEMRAVFRRGLELIRGRFEDRTWQAFWLTVVEERSSAEVGHELKMTPGAVRQAKYKVLRRLRAELGDLLE